MADTAPSTAPITLQRAGEFGTIARIRELLDAGEGPRPLIGIGDDAAAWRQEAATLVATTDMLIEGIHFELTTTSWRDLGWKALAVNLSDVAAMGAAPRWCLVSVGLKGSVPLDDVLALYAGMKDLAQREACPIVGGDTVASPHDQVLSVTVVGAVPVDEASTLMRRDAGAVGDLVAVTGTLGGSAAGLFTLQHPEAAPSDCYDVLAAAHRRPQPRLAAGRALRLAGVRCAMDVSDGLLADLEKVCAASGVSAVVQAESIPIHPAARRAFPARALEWAASGGEDYELLFAAPEPVMARALAALSAIGCAATAIGALAAGDGRVRLVDGSGAERPLRVRGWDHFGSGPVEPR